MTGRQGQPAGQGWDSGISSSTTDHGWKTRTTARREKGDPSTAHLPYANRQREEGASREQDAGTARGAYRDHAVVATGAATPGRATGYRPRSCDTAARRGMVDGHAWGPASARAGAHAAAERRPLPVCFRQRPCHPQRSAVDGSARRSVGSAWALWLPGLPRSGVSWARAAGCGRPGWSRSISTEIPGVCVARDSMGYVRQRFWLISTSHRHGGKIGCTRGTMKNQRFQFAGSFNVYLWPVACTIRTRRAPRKPASVVARSARGARTRRLTGGGRRRSLAAIRRRMGASPRR
jgi:hypothetical protein